MTTLAHYHKSVRKITTAFASLFNNIVLIRDNVDGTENQRIIVPLEFGDKEKYVKRLQGDPELEKKIQIVLPRMSYELTGFSYDASRKLNTNNKNFAQGTSNDRLFYQFNPVPYDFNFSLTIYTRNIEDGNQIIEQIIPYFTPDYTVKVNLVPSMGIVRNLPIILNSAEPTIDSDGVFSNEVRTVFWTLGFTVKGFIFGGIKDGPAIKDTSTNIISSGFIVGDVGNEGGVCCSGNVSKSFLLESGGHGNYRINEIVYQGINYDNSYASGKVVDWSSNTNTSIIIISDICGDFKLNQPLIGSDSVALHVIKSPAQNTIIDLKVLVTPNPNTALANTYWTTNTKILEYPNT